MMKNWRFWTGISVGAAVALLVVATASLALAQGPGPEGTYPGFVDEDGNGICDNFVDEDGDGVCDLRGNGWRNGSGRGFVGQA